MEKEKAAEKAEVKGGIHGRLEKAKAEIKAKEGDKVPKNKSKELGALTDKNKKLMNDIFKSSGL